MYWSVKFRAKILNTFTQLLTVDMAEHNAFGVRGEELACKYLIEHEYELIAVNWRAFKYEIDIIAKKDNTIVFVEVKTRATHAFGSPEESINSYKENHLISGAEVYLERNNIDMECRFDVISIVMDKRGAELRHIKDALG